MIKRQSRLFSQTTCLLKKRGNELDLFKILGRNSNHLSAGVVGLANVGKSTFFQAITKTKLGNPANYPFATIDAEESTIVVESERLNNLQRIYKSKKKIPTTLKIYDIAGLTRNASTGEGLGNKFLNDIRQVDGIFQMVRGFQDDEIIHIEKSVDPIRDMVIVLDELMLKDLEIIESAIEKLERQLKKPGSKDLINKELKLLREISDSLYDGVKVSNFEFKDVESVEMVKKHNLLTIKPTIYLLNVNKDDYLRNDNEFKGKIEEWLKEHSPHDSLVLICAKYENELLDNPDDKYPSIIPPLISKMRESLNLISFFTCGPEEAREWTVKNGATAAEGAGVIHTDLKDGFIMAQVHKYEDIKNDEEFNESSLKTRGLFHKYGKNHTIEDGDLILFKSSKGKAR